MLDKIPTEINTGNNDIIEIEIKDDYKKTLDNIASYLERDDVRSLNTNSIILYEKLWNDVEIILNAPNKKEIYESYHYGNAFIYAEKELNLNIYDNRLKFFFNLVMYLYH